jgi:hypothetical protein
MPYCVFWKPDNGVEKIWAVEYIKLNELAEYRKELFKINVRIAISSIKRYNKYKKILDNADKNQTKVYPACAAGYVPIESGGYNW